MELGRYVHIISKEIITVVKFKPMYLKYKNTKNEKKFMALDLLIEHYTKID